MVNLNIIFALITAPFYFVASLVMIWGGIVYMTSAGNPERTNHAKKIIFYDIVGIIIATSSWQLIAFTASFVSSLTQ